MSEQLDPHSFSGAFAELESDLPAAVRLADWRSEAGRRRRDRPGPRAGRAPQRRTVRAWWRALWPRSGRGPDLRRTR